MREFFDDGVESIKAFIKDKSNGLVLKDGN
jgi:hypothetical protein